MDSDPDADPNLTYHPDADPDSDFLFYADPDADLDPTFHPDADPDPDPSFKKKAQTLEKICKVMLIRIRFRIQLINFDAYPDSDIYLMRKRIQMLIQDTKMIRILEDLDPQHCFLLRNNHSNSGKIPCHADVEPMRQWRRSILLLTTK
jgi:hypothetical protein